MYYADFVREKLSEYGFGTTESILDEWNTDVSTRGTAHRAAVCAAVILAAQNRMIDCCVFYDAHFGTSIYGGIFNPLTAKPFTAYYSFCGFNELYRRVNQVSLTCNTSGIYAVAAHSEIGGGMLMISNISGKPEKLELAIGKYTVTHCKIIDSTHTYETTELPDIIGNDYVLCLLCENGAD